MTIERIFTAAPPMAQTSRPSRSGAASVSLGLRENLSQFALLVIVNAFVGQFS